MSKKRNDMKDKIFEVAKNHTENEETAMQLTNELCVLLGVIKKSEQLTFNCEWCEDTGVMITGMDCTCDKAPSKS